ncbi:MAG TPA: hypothetical protein VFB60_02845, partial [Ktedonobacteraceae bacterium]|nr:hypothetical protein [Ktedonobacteraceae bacterium]
WRSSLRNELVTQGQGQIHPVGDLSGFLLRVYQKIIPLTLLSYKGQGAVEGLGWGPCACPTELAHESFSI